MLKYLVGLGLFCSLAGASGADSAHRAMILKVQGRVAAGKQPVLTGQLLDDHNVLDLQPNSSVTLLLLNKGQRLEVGGKGKLTVDAGEIHVSQGATVRVLGSNQQKLSLNGENHRAIGGAVMRAVELGRAVLPSTAFDKVEVREGQGLVCSRPAGEGAPPQLRFQYMARYTVPEVGADGVAVCKLPTEEQRILFFDVPGISAGSRWSYEVSWPKADYQSMGLVVQPVDGDRPVLYTWVYQTSPQEEQELRSLAREVEAWTAREPQSIEPLVIYASLLEDRGYLEEARQQLDRALALRSKEPGLRVMKARVLTELGRYAEASKFLAR